MSIAGKTGSCIADKTWVGLFASVAPIENPRYSVVVITKGLKARGKYSAAIAGEIYAALKPHFYQKPYGIVSRKTFTDDLPLEDKSKATAKLSISGDSETISNNEISKQETNQNSKVEDKNKPVNSNKVVEKKELFPTIVINGKAEITRPRVVQNR